MNNIPPITKNLLIINVLCFLAFFVLKTGGYGIDLNDVLGLHFFLAEDFRPWQLLTYMFMHGGWEHLFFNMFALWMFGRILEQVLGDKRFLIYYLICGISAGCVQEVAQLIQYYSMGLSSYELVQTSHGTMAMGSFLNAWTTVGASGAVYGILLAFGYLFPEERMFVFPVPFPIKAKYFVVGYALIELTSALAQRGDGVAHCAHLGGMFFGWLLLRHWKKMRIR